MVVFPNAKINIGLHILNKREDGYHNLESIFYPIGLCDVLEVIKADQFTFQQTGLTIDGNPSDNLVIKAYELIRTSYNTGPVAIHLHKVIPMGAGLGGGSADGAFMLKALNELFNLNLSEDALLDLALQLGSDCPFFIHNVPCRVTGRGEHVKKVQVDPAGLWIKVVHSGLHVSTKEAFQGVSLTNELLKSEPADYIDLSKSIKRFVNDFENSLFPKYPILSGLKNELLKEGAIYASMTGSGSAIYGFFDSEPAKTNLAQFEFIAPLTPIK